MDGGDWAESGDFCLRSIDQIASSHAKPYSFRPVGRQGWGVPLKSRGVTESLGTWSLPPFPNLEFCKTMELNTCRKWPEQLFSSFSQGWHKFSATFNAQERNFFIPYNECFSAPELKPHSTPAEKEPLGASVTLSSHYSQSLGLFLHPTFWVPATMFTPSKAADWKVCPLGRSKNYRGKTYISWQWNPKLTTPTQTWSFQSTF